MSDEIEKLKNCILRLEDKLGKLTQKCKKIQQENKQFKQIIHDLKVHVYAYDAQHYYLFCNQQLAQDGGYNSSDEVIGKTNYDLAWHAAADQLVANNEQAKAARKTLVFEEKILINHKMHIFLSIKTPLFDEAGNYLSLVGISQDITEIIKKFTYANNLNVGQIHYLEVLDQELRRITGNIVSIASLGLQLNDDTTLAAPQLATRHQEYYQIIKTSINSIHPRVERLLNFFKLVTEQTPPFFEMHNIRELVEGAIVSKYSYELAKHNLTLNFDYDALLPTHVTLETKIFSSILETLLHNALRFTQAGVITLSFSLVQSLAQDYLKVMVTDTGIGLGGDVSHLFDIFSATITEIKPGAPGFMLSLCKLMLQHFGGEIGYLPMAHGTSFWFTVPVQETSQINHPVAVETILIIDHDSARASYQQHALSPYFRQVKTYVSATLAQDYAELMVLDDVDYLVLDQQNPQLVDFLNVIKNTVGETKVIVLAEPLARLTGYEPCVWLHFIDKPLLPSQFHQQVTKLLQQDATHYRHILWVEDDQLAEMATKPFLENSGFTVTLAKTAQAALTLLHEQSFDILLVDFVLPDRHAPDFLVQVQDQALFMPEATVIYTALDNLATRKLADTYNVVRKSGSHDLLIQVLQQVK